MKAKDFLKYFKNKEELLVEGSLSQLKDILYILITWFEDEFISPPTEEILEGRVKHFKENELGYIRSFACYKCPNKEKCKIKNKDKIKLDKIVINIRLWEVYYIFKCGGQWTENLRGIFNYKYEE
jgi:hypothetical protein